MNSRVLVSGGSLEEEVGDNCDDIDLFVCCCQIPAFAISGGKVVGGGSFPEDPFEAVKTLGLVGEVMVFDQDAEEGKDVIVDYKESNMGFLDGVPKERITLAVKLNASGSGEAILSDGKSLKEAMSEISYYANRVVLQFDHGFDRKVVESAKSLLEKGMMLNVLNPPTTDDIAFLDSLGVESILGTCLQDGSMTIPEALKAVLVSDRPDGLIPTVVVDEDMVTLGLCYSNLESLAEAFKRSVGVYWRWTSAIAAGKFVTALQELLRVDLDCDRDSMRFVVRQSGSGFCHMEQMSCFGEDHGTLGALMRTLIDRKNNAPAGSYTKRLFDDDVLLKSKLLEECEELLAAKDNKEASVAWETADVIYFAFAACARHGVDLAKVQRNLSRKALRVRRRPGNAKPPGWKPGDPSPDAGQNPK
ncbi:hypothetical protein GUITHDRAFT_107751 [Guillardia theta CCMP2712]|uniref:Phosphoribosyl-AMP cyclohydrolase domain-containing protein n=1 Tax=Guillardia theta (strain CCMP2712) TaxID=905079 RepID=L1JE03_GUITC|nr:hypothetical protein GUITHDRAFT_107751 [Guillardia theta CCMP2712]EKX46547.1 hypothetical protein GUITHDRAFT_107751 [Guillardia theta CCMP2712]|eukprot:XP_005833527.1 hypothetical protein GUITHDRAFT_107751 [Guillardia theta CCMP2712]